jgi:catecholate siderophore receptor
VRDTNAQGIAAQSTTVQAATAQGGTTTAPALDTAAPRTAQSNRTELPRINVRGNKRSPRRAAHVAPVTPRPVVPVVPNPGGDVGYHAENTSTATKTNTPLRDIPQAISVVTKQQVQDIGAQRLEDVTHYIPGVNWHQGEGNRDQIVIRGQSSTADFFVNGMRDDGQVYRDLYNTERLEYLKGPNALIFGHGRGSSATPIDRVRRLTSSPSVLSAASGAPVSAAAPVIFSTINVPATPRRPVV